MKKFLLVLSLFLTACAGGGYPYPGDNGELPTGGGKVIYIRNPTSGGTPYRIIQVGPCFIEEVVYYGHWLAQNKSGFFDNGGSPATCT